MNQALISALGATLLALGVSGIAWSDHDHAERAGGAPPHAGYQAECGSCHLAYPPGLMSAADWGQVMGTLTNHFGDDASLDPGLAAEILGYLRANATGRGQVPSRAVPPVNNREGPPRITQTRYFLRKHDEVPIRMVRGNTKIGSFSNCQACHGDAAQGRFDEDDVTIPGMGRWED